MSRTTVTKIINAPADVVFITISDINRFAEAVPDIVHIEILSDIKSGTGTRFRETRNINGREATTELEVTEYKENEQVRMVADSHGTIWDSVFTVKTVEGGTELKLVMEAKPYRFLSRLMNPFMKGFIKKALEKDMDAVQTYCEQ